MHHFCEKRHTSVLLVIIDFDILKFCMSNIVASCFDLAPGNHAKCGAFTFFHAAQWVNYKILCANV